MFDLSDFVLLRLMTPHEDSLEARLLYSDLGL